MSREEVTLAETRRPVDVSDYIHEEESLKLHESRCKIYLYPECITLQHTLSHFQLPALSSRLLNI